MKPVSLVATLLIFLLACSCGGPKESATTDSTANTTDSLTLTVSDEKITSIADVLSLLPELTAAIEYNEEYFDNYDSLQRLFQKAPAKVCAQMSSSFISDDVWCDDNAYFVWKISYETFTLVDFITTSFNPKGQCVYHHLVTVDKDGQVIEIYPEWAATYAVGVENPNGGTSAGVEYKTGQIEINPIVRVTSTGADGNTVRREVQNDGHFVENLLLKAEEDLSGEDAGESDNNN